MESTSELWELLSEFGARLAPLHSDSEDPLLRTYFVAFLSESQAGGFLERIRNMHGAEAAYVKPPDEAP